MIINSQDVTEKEYAIVLAGEQISLAGNAYSIVAQRNR